MFDGVPQLPNDFLFTLPDGRVAAIGYENAYFEDEFWLVVQAVIGEPTFSFQRAAYAGSGTAGYETRLEAFLVVVNDWILENYP